VKTYRQHRCGRNHQRYNTFIRCAIPRAHVIGDGRYAVIAWCHHEPTVFLYDNEAVAEDRLDMLLCDGACTFKHELVQIDLDHQRRMDALYA
jgi:hypothetical protein